MMVILNVALSALTTANGYLAYAALSLILTIFAIFILIKFRLPLIFRWFVLLNILILNIGYAFDLYDSIWYFNKVAHFHTAFTVTRAAVYIFNPVSGNNTRLISLIVPLSVGIAFGTIWEIGEWLAHTINPLFELTLTDTFTDLIVDLGGALLALIPELHPRGERLVTRFMTQSSPHPSV